MDSLSLVLVLLIPLVVLAALAGLFFLGRYLQQQARQELKQLGSSLRRLRSDRHLIEAEARAYAEDEPAPFQERLAGLRAALQEISQLWEAIEAQRIQLHERANQLDRNPWRSMLGAPYLWYYLRRDIADARVDLENLRQALAMADELRQALARTSLDVAQQARETIRLQQELARLLEQLEQHNLHGQAMQEAARQHQRLRSSLEPLPEVFLSGDEQAVLAVPDRQSVADVHATIAATRPELDRLLAQAAAWDEQRRQAGDRVAQMRRLLDEAQQAASVTPSEIQIKEQRAQLDGLEVIARSLQDTLARLEVESIPQVIVQADNVSQSARETTAVLQNARRDLAVLQSLRAELSAGFREISLQMATLGSRATHPVLWKDSTDTLTVLSKQGSSIGPANKTRTPEQIGKDLAVIQGVASEQKELARYIQQVSAASDELVELLGGAQLTGFGEWLDLAERTAQQAGEYAAENWTKADAAEALPAEVETLAAQAERLVLNEAGEPVPEAEMVRRLADTRTLAADYQKLRRRVDGISHRLADLQLSESQAYEQLDASEATLGQILLIVRSNQFLGGVAGAETERLSSDLQKARQALDERQRGSVDKKFRQVGALANRLEQNGNHWLDQLNHELATSLKDLSAMLAQLDAIAQFEDPPIVEAHRLLSSGPMYGAGGYESKSRFRLGDLTAEFKRRSDYWHSISAAQNAVNDTSGPLLDRYEEAAFQRTKAREALEEAASFMGKKRAWPPTNVTLDAERREMDSLEALWQGLKGSTGRAIQLLARVDELAARYATLAERAGHNLERAHKEQSDVGELESEIQTMLATWQRLDTVYSDKEVAHDEITNLLATIEAELEQVRKKYGQGALYYNQVFEKLRALNRRVRLFQATLDDSHALDINGNVIGKRQSSYRDNIS